jgi:hypothetical protein
MLEHPEADHEGYKFPVDVEFIGEKPKDLPEWDDSYEKETHALFHVVGNCVLTGYECCYDIWRLDNGEHIGGSSWYASAKIHHNIEGKSYGYNTSAWRLTEESLVKIREYHAKTKST